MQGVRSSSLLGSTGLTKSLTGFFVGGHFYLLALRDPSMHNLFQIADVDSGVIRWVNADLVTHILPREPKQ